MRRQNYNFQEKNRQLLFLKLSVGGGGLGSKRMKKEERLKLEMKDEKTFYSISIEELLKT